MGAVLLGLTSGCGTTNEVIGDSRPLTMAGDASPGVGGSSGKDAGAQAACSGVDESCASGRTCCNKLMCCTGEPVIAGEEFCAIDCPDSDRNLKVVLAEVDPEQILDAVAQLPITYWRYRADDRSARHIGPMAQDFRAAFEVGVDDRSIQKVDADGVALAAIQALSARLERVEAENVRLRQYLLTLERRLGRRSSERGCRTGDPP